MTIRQELSALKNTRWQGQGELWLDPLGDEVTRYPCSAELGDGELSYIWTRDDKEHRGVVRWSKGEGQFQDSFHQDDEVECCPLPGAKAPVALTYDYGPEQRDWGWQILITLRPHNGDLVVQMTNIAPWGEEARAVRMVFQRAP